MTVVVYIPTRKQTVTISREPPTLTVCQLERILRDLIAIEPGNMRLRQKYTLFVCDNIVSNKKLTLGEYTADRFRNRIIDPITICGKRVGPFRDMNIDFQNPSINSIDIIDFDPRMIDCIITMSSKKPTNIQLYQEENRVNIKVEEILQQEKYLYIITFKPIINKTYSLRLDTIPFIENLEFIFREWKLRPTNFFSDIDIY